MHEYLIPDLDRGIETTIDFDGKTWLITAQNVE